MKLTSIVTLALATICLGLAILSMQQCGDDREQRAIWEERQRVSQHVIDSLKVAKIKIDSRTDTTVKIVERKIAGQTKIIKDIRTVLDTATMDSLVKEKVSSALDSAESVARSCNDLVIDCKTARANDAQIIANQEKQIRNKDGEIKVLGRKKWTHVGAQAGGGACWVGDGIKPCAYVGFGVSVGI